MKTDLQSETSWLRNCILAGRPGDGPLFDGATIEGAYLARLDGYAIIPVETYQALLSGKSAPIQPPEPSSNS